MRFPTHNNRTTSKYEWRYRTNSEGEQYIDYHGGIDLGAVMAGVGGDYIYSIADNSKVVFVGYDKWRGHNIILEHNSHCTRYCHLSRALVSEGDIVSEANVIGIMGSSGKSTGAHLHFEVHACKYEDFYDKWSNGEYKHTVDPELFFAMHKTNHELREKLSKINEISG